jgi:hypothetical protein
MHVAIEGDARAMIIGRTSGSFSVGLEDSTHPTLLLWVSKTSVWRFLAWRQENRPRRGRKKRRE